MASIAAILLLRYWRYGRAEARLGAVPGSADGRTDCQLLAVHSPLVRPVTITGLGQVQSLYLFCCITQGYQATVVHTGSFTAEPLYDGHTGKKSFHKLSWPDYTMQFQCTVEPPSKGHFGINCCVLREDVLFSEVSKCNITMGIATFGTL